MVTIINYGIGNVNSIVNILKKVGIASRLGSTKEELLDADKLVLPGVGHFDHCMKKFNSSGLREVTEKKVIGDKTPILGICVGCQMFMERSEEGGEAGLGWFSGEVVHFDASRLRNGSKIPHMGWAHVKPRSHQGLYEQMDDPRFYFVHSYHLQASDPTLITATAEYGYEFIASVGRDNIQGVQFHPEKSHRFGMQLYANFGKAL